MRLLPRSVLGSLGSVLSPKKGNTKGDGKSPAAPSVPAAGKDVPSAGIPVPSIASDLPTPGVMGVAKELPTPSAAGAAKNPPPPNTAGPADAKADPSTITTSITVTVTDTTTITSASTTLTITMHDLATIASPVPTTITIKHHDLTTLAKAIPTTITTTATPTPSTPPTSTARPTATPLSLTPALPTPHKGIDAATVVAVVFGILIMGLLGVIAFLVLKCRRMAKAAPKVAAKSYAEEFEWAQDGAVEAGRDGQGGRKDEWGPKQKEAWGVV